MYYFLNLDRRTRSPPPNRVRALTAVAELISGTPGSVWAKATCDTAAITNNSLSIVCMVSSVRTAQMREFYFFRRARRTRMEPPSNVSAPIADAGLISGTTGTPAIATTEELAIPSINPMVFFTFPPIRPLKLDSSPTS